MTQRNWAFPVLLLCAAGAAAAPALSYRLTQIDADPPGILPIFVTDLNDKGVVVGLSDANNPDARHAFLWRHGKYSDLNARIDGAVVSEASGINNRSEVIGQYFDPQGTERSFLLRKGKFTQIDCFAEDINNRGQIAGESCIWDRGEVTVLPPFGVRQINDLGVVVGTGSFAPNRLRAVIWQEGQLIDLGVPPGFFDSRGRGINNRGQVIGTVEGGTITSGFLWEDGMMMLLPRLAADKTNAPLSINDAGEIVGISEFPQGGGGAAILWDEEGQIFDLNELISSSDPLRPFVGLAVGLLFDNRGRIVAVGSDSRDPDRTRYYLLRPAGRR
jgi:probable HAF family extracellular repeat protein